MGGRAATMALLEEEERERKERAVGEQQQKEGAARRQRGTRGTRASFGGAVAKLALVTLANIGALQAPRPGDARGKEARSCHI